MAKSVDERVVEMRFENKQFEQGISESLKSLDELKKALDFDNIKNSAKAFEQLGNAVDDIDFNKMSDQLDFLEKRFSTLGVAGMTAISELTKSVMNFGKTLYNNTIGQIKSGGLSRALNIENAKFQLKGLGVEWDKIKDDIDYGVSGTAYGLDAAAKAASSLVASGVQLGDNMKTSLRAISGVAAMTNSSYEEISSIFTTVAGQGKLMTMQLRQLESRGLNAAAAIGEQMGYTESEIRDMVTKGKIQFADFAAAMDDAFGEHSKEANNTFNGALSNMKAALSRIGQNFYTPYLDNMRLVFNSIRQLINKVNPMLKPFYDLTERAFQGFAKFVDKITTDNNVTRAIQQIINGLVHIVNGFLTVLYPIQTAFENIFGDNISKAILNIATEFSKLTKEFGLNRNQMLSLRFAFEGIFKVVKAVATIIGQILKTILPPLSTALQIIFAVIGKVASSVAIMLGNVTDLGSQLSPMEIILKALGKVLEVVNIALAAIGIVIIKIFDVLSNFHILDAVAAAVNAIGTALGFVVGVVGLVIEKVKDLHIVQNVLNTILFIVQAIKNVAVGIVAGVIFAITTLVNKIIEINDRFQITQRISLTVQKAINNVKMAFKALGDQIHGIYNRLTNGESILTIIKDKLEKVKQVLATFGTKVKDAFIKVLHSDGLSWFRDIIEKLREIIPPADSAKAALERFVNFIKDHAGMFVAAGFLAMTAAMTISIKKFIDAGTGLATSAKGFIDGIKKMFSPPVKKAKTTLEQLAIVIGVVAGSLTLLSYVAKENGNLEQVANILMKFVAAGAGFAVIMKVLTMIQGAKKWTPEAKKSVKDLGIVFIGLGVAVAGAAAALKIISGLNFSWKKDWQIITALGAIMLEMGLITTLVGKMMKNTASLKAVVFLVSFVYSLSKLLDALKSLQGMDSNQLLNSVKAMSILMVALGALGVGAGHIKITTVAAIYLLFKVMGDKIYPLLDKIASQYDNADKWISVFESHEKAFGIFTACISALILSLGFAGKGIKKASTGLFILVGAFALMAKVVDYLGKIPENQLYNGVGVLTAFSGIVALLMVLSAETKGSKMLQFAVSLGIIVGIFALMGKLAVKLGELAGQEGYALEKGIVVLGVLTTMVGVLEYLSGKTKDAKTVPILALCAVITYLVAELIVLTTIPWEKLLPATVSLSAVLLSLGYAMNSMSKITKDTKVLKGTVAMIFMIAEIATALTLMSKFGGSWEQIAASGVGLAVALVAYAKAIEIISGIKEIKDVSGKAKLFAAMLIPLAGIAGSLLLISNFSGSLDRVLAAGAGLAAGLVGFGLAVGAIVKLGDGVKQIPKGMFATLTGMAIAAVALGAALAMLTAYDWQNSIYDAAFGLSIVMGAMAGVIVVLSKFSGEAKNAIAGAAAMAIVGFSLLEVAQALAAFMDYGVDWPQVFQAVVIMGVMAGAIALLGKAVGALNALGGAAAFAIAALGVALIAQALTQFTKIDVGAVGNAIAVILTLAGAVGLLGVIGPMAIVGALALDAAAAAIIIAGYGLQSVATAFDMFADVLQHFIDVLTVMDGAAIAQNLIQVAQGLQALVEPIMGLAVDFLIFAAACAVLTAGIPGLFALAAVVQILSSAISELMLSFTQFVDALERLCSLDTSNLGTNMQNFASAMWDLMKAAVQFSFMKDLGKDLAELATSITVFNTASMGLTASIVQLQNLGTAAEEAGIKMEEGGKKVQDTAERVFGTELYAKLKASVEYAVQGIADGLENNQTAIAAFTKLGTDVLEKGFYPAVGQGSPWETMKAAVKWAAEGLKEGVAKFAGGAVEKFSEWGGKAKEAFNGAMEGLGDFTGISDGIEGLKDKFSGLGGVLDGIKNMDFSSVINDLSNLAGIDLSNIAGAAQLFGINLLGDGSSEGNDPFENISNIFKEITGGLGDVGSAATGAGKASKQSAKDQKELEEAFENLSMTTDVMRKEYGKLYEEMGKTEAFETMMAAIGESEEALDEFKDRWKGVYDAVDSALQNIFDAPKEREWMDKNALLANMRENINQVSQWAHEMGELSKKAGANMSQELYDKLRQLGPEGYKYVHAFSEMTDEELQQASDMFSESITLKTAAANRVTAGYYNVGVMCVEGLADGLENEKEAVEAATTTMAHTLEAAQEEAGVQSPSWKMEEIGNYMMQGLIIGFYNSTPSVVFAVEVVTNRILTEFSKMANREELTQLGQRVIAKIAAGMMLGEQTLNEITNDIIGHIALAIENKARELNQNGSFICQYLVQGFREEMDKQEKEIDSAIDTLVEFAVDHATEDHEDDYVGITQFLVEAITTELLNKKTTLKLFQETIDELLKYIIDDNLSSDDTYSRFVDVGYYWAEGMAEGINAGAEMVMEAAMNLASLVESVTTSREGLWVASPSKKARKIGKWWAEGLALGMNDGKSTVYNSALALTEGIVKVAQITEPKIKKAFDKIFDGVDEIATKKVAKTIAKMTNTIQVYNITDTVAQAFVPVKKLVGETAESVGSSVKKITVNLYNANKTVEEQVKKAIKWTKKFNDNLMDLDSIDTLIKPLQKINKYFSDFNQVPKKVLNFLGKLKKEMRPVNDLVKEMTSEYYHLDYQMNKFSNATTDARIGILRLGSAILETTDAGKEYLDAVEAMTEAEEKLHEAENAEEPNGEEIEKLSIAYEEAKDKVTTFASALSKAVDEYRQKLRAAILESMDLFNQFDFGEKFNPTNLIGNMFSHFNGVEAWKNGFVQLATNGLSPAILQQLADENVESYDKVMSLAAANPKTLAIINKLYEEREQKAKKAANKVTKALAYAYTDDAAGVRKALEEMMDEGDEAFMQMYQGNLEHYQNFLKEYDASSQQYTSFITNMQSVTAELSGVIDAAGRSILGIADASKSTASETMVLYDSLINLGNVFGVVAEDAQETGNYIGEVTAKFQEWLGTVREGLTISNPFEKFNQDLTYTTEQLKYNMNSQLAAVKEFTEGIHAMANMGYSSELIKYVSSLGYENGLKYVQGFTTAEQNEVGYFNDAYREMLEIPDTLADEIGADLLATGTEMGKALQDGVKEAFEKNGVYIPLKDPSEKEEVVEAASEAGEEAGEEYAESFTYMSVDGIQNGVNNGMAELKTVFKQAGEKAGSKAGKSAGEALSTSLGSSETQSAVSQNVQRVLVYGVTQAGTAVQTETTNVMSNAFTNLSSSVITPFADSIKKIIGNAFTDAANQAVTRFNDAVNKIKEKINQIPKSIDIKVNVDTSEIDTAISKINQAISAANKLGSAAASAAKAASSAGGGGGGGGGSSSSSSSGSSSSSATSSSGTTTKTLTQIMAEYVAQGKKAADAIRDYPTLLTHDTPVVNITVNNPTQQSLVKTRSTLLTTATQVSQALK